MKKTYITAIVGGMLVGLISDVLRVKAGVSV